MVNLMEKVKYIIQKIILSLVNGIIISETMLLLHHQAQNKQTVVVHKCVKII